MTTNLIVKILLVVSFVLSRVYEGIKDYLSRSYYDKELPDNVRDVYDEAEYKNWLAYSKDKNKFYSLQSIVDGVVLMAFLVFDVYARIFEEFSEYNLYLQYFCVLAIFSIITIAVGIPFDYYHTFFIEEKYGLNTTTRKTFAADCIKNIITNILLSYGLLALIVFFFEKFGNTAIIFTSIAIIAISIIISLLVMPILRIYNKFAPLEDGELKRELLALCEKYGVEVKKICVKDASRRTTRANAFCTGFTRKKVISLDDNLVNGYSTEQIVAVFAHEFAHATYRHMLKSFPFAIFRSMLTIIFLGIALNIPSLFTAFGFTGINYFFAINIIPLLNWPVEELLDIVTNYLSRKHEFEADRFAAKEGYGEALISCLKTLSKESLSNVNPHPYIVMVDYSHPTLSQRIAAIREQNN